MSITEQYGNPAEVAWRFIGEDATRRGIGERVSLYRDRCLDALLSAIRKAYTSISSQEHLGRLAEFATLRNLVRRFADEIADPIYSRAPTRNIDPESDVDAWLGISRETQHDESMSAVASMVEAFNDVVIQLRHSPTLGMVLDVLTPDIVTIIPHVDDHTQPVGICYQSTKWIDGKATPCWVVWDDEQFFAIGDRGFLVVAPQMHELGRMPFVSVHRRKPIGTYWDSYRNKDVESATRRIMLLLVQMLGTIQVQGHLQLAWTGDSAAQVKTQEIGPTKLIKLQTDGGQGSLQVLNLQAKVDAYLNEIDATETSVGAAHGFSRERLNQSTDIHGSDTALLQQTESLMQRMRRAEQDMWDLYKVISLQHPQFQLGADAQMEVDFGQLHHRVDRKTQLEIREAERKAMLRTPLDDIREDNPEIISEQEARDQYEDNLATNTALNEELAKRNGVAGQGSPEANGRLGPMIRDFVPSGE